MQLYVFFSLQKYFSQYPNPQNVGYCRLIFISFITVAKKIAITLPASMMPMCPKLYPPSVNISAAAPAGCTNTRYMSRLQEQISSKAKSQQTYWMRYTQTSHYTYRKCRANGPMQIRRQRRSFIRPLIKTCRQHHCECYQQCNCLT